MKVRFLQVHLPVCGCFLLLNEALEGSTLDVQRLEASFILLPEPRGVALGFTFVLRGLAIFLIVSDIQERLRRESYRL